MVEVSNIKQNADEPRRRWFASDELELVVWCDEQGLPIRFELIYDKRRAEHALIWQRERGFSHMAVDDGETVGGRHKATPLLVAERCRFPANRVAQQFANSNSGLPRDFAEFVETQLQHHPNYVREA